MSAPNSRHVSFAPDVKPAAVPASGVTVKKEPGVKKEPADCVLDGTERLDGVIGTLLVRQSGRIQMELGNGAIYDVRNPNSTEKHKSKTHGLLGHALHAAVVPPGRSACCVSRSTEAGRTRPSY